MTELDITDKHAFLKAAICETLRLVPDPELGINIIDMGLVYSIEVNKESNQITIQMTLSSPHCPMGAAIVGAVENCMQHHYQKYATVINLVWEPQWTYEAISEEGKRLLGM